MPKSFLDKNVCTHHFVDGKVDKIENEEDDIAHEHDQVECARVARTRIAVTAAAVVASKFGRAQQRSDNDAENDFNNLYDTAVRLQIVCVEPEFGHDHE